MLLFYCRPWETYPPNEYPTTNSLQGYQPKPNSQYPSDSRDPRSPSRHPSGLQQYPPQDRRQQDRHSQDRRPQSDRHPQDRHPQDRQQSQRDPRYREYPPPQQRPAQPAPHTRFAYIVVL